MGRAAAPRASAALLGAPVASLPGVGAARAALLGRVGVATVGDLLHLLPRRYEDRRGLVAIADLVPGAPASFAARVAAAGPQVTPGRRRRVFRATFEDPSGTVAAVWFRFRAPHLASLLPAGARVIVHGAVVGEGAARAILHPEIEPLGAGGARRGPAVRPVYPATEGLAQATLRRLVRGALDAVLPELGDPLPVGLRARLRLAGLAESLAAIHAPGDDARPELLASPSSPWRRRLLFDRLLGLQLRLALRRAAHAAARPRRGGAPPGPAGDLAAGLPFALTGAQRRVLGEILDDLAGPRPMQRLLQGDVGCGKTVVAALAARRCVGAGGQAALLAPTGILAEQHWTGLRRLGAAAALLTGGTPAPERRRVLAGLADGTIRFVVGTHALLAAGVRFRRLALAIVDEQHRFGVRQRLRLREKGEAPDLLVMTATPIPRSLALALFGDLDLSVIDELPPGRGGVVTEVLGPGDRRRVREAIAAEIAAGGRAFVVCPVAGAGGEEDPAAARRAAEALRREGAAPAVGLVHGGMPLAERVAALERLRTGETPLLVATTVIEVGIDVPEAGLIVVEGAERFGLSQLHQLRGRVGRGVRPGRCLLVAGPGGGAPARDRLAVLARTADGFAVAEADLALRGPGELAGLRQAGEGALGLADLAADPALLAAAREEARRVVAADPGLGLPRHRALRFLAGLRAAGEGGDGDPETPLAEGAESC